MRTAKIILVFLSIFTLMLVGGGKTVLGQYGHADPSDVSYPAPVLPVNPAVPPKGLTEEEILREYWDPVTDDKGKFVDWIFTGEPNTTGDNSKGYTNGDYSGFYLLPDGSYHPVGTIVSSGYSNDGSCNPNSWTAWTACPVSCGQGVISRQNGCGGMQYQACEINDPFTWTAWSTCTVNCGGGTQGRTNECGF